MLFQIKELATGKSDGKDFLLFFTEQFAVALELPYGALLLKIANSAVSLSADTGFSSFQKNVGSVPSCLGKSSVTRPAIIIWTIRK